MFKLVRGSREIKVFCIFNLRNSVKINIVIFFSFNVFLINGNKNVKLGSFLLFLLWDIVKINKVRGDCGVLKGRIGNWVGYEVKWSWGEEGLEILWLRKLKIGLWRDIMCLILFLCFDGVILGI